MSGLSRRQLAQYAADQLLVGHSVKSVASHLGAVLVETRRTDEMELLLTDIAWELESRGKLAQAIITSATPLNDKLRRELNILVKKTAKVEQVRLQENVDKSVLGGLRVETAIHAWDKTVVRALTDIREVI